MNLAKKGTVLLAALSVFAMTSCGGAKEEELSYDKAKTWVAKNYGSETKTRTISKSHVDWDYSKNKNDVVAPETWKTYLPQEEVNLNWFLKYSLTNTFGIDDDDEAKGNKDIDYAKSIISDMGNKTCSEASFDDFFDDSFSFKAKGKELIAAETKTGQDVYISLPNDMTDHFTIKFTEIDTYYFGSDGYLKRFDVSMYSDDCKITLEVQKKEAEKPIFGPDTSSFHLLDTTVITTPILK